MAAINGNGNGYGYGNGDGNGYGDGYGYGNGYGNGNGYGYGSGNGYGYGYGYGDGYGYGYGYGDGYGDGDGYGNGYGNGYGDGNGYGYGYGYGKSFWQEFCTWLAGDAKGAIPAIWKSDSLGNPANGGSLAKPVEPGDIHELPGPLRTCSANALHATHNPEKWKGDRWWLVLMYPPYEIQDDKIGSLKREILYEII